MIGTFMIWRNQSKHPDPDCAVRLGFILIARALRELILYNSIRTFRGILLIDDDTLQQEFRLLCLPYLGDRETEEGV